MIHPQFDFAGRMKRARHAMLQAGIDVMLVSVGSDLPYLTGYEAVPSERLTMAAIPLDLTCLAPLLLGWACQTDCGRHESPGC